MTNPDLVLCEFQSADPGELQTYSPFCLKVRRALDYVDLAFSVRKIGGPGELKRLNTLCQVPVLLVGDQPVCDSTTILERIETLSNGRLHKNLSDAEKSEALLWEEFADRSLNNFVIAARWADDDNWARSRTAFFGSMPLPLRLIVPGRLRARVLRDLIGRDVWRGGAEVCWRSFNQQLAALEERAPQQGFWVASQLSVADLAIFAQLQSLRCDLTPEQRDTLQRRPRLIRYLDRVSHATQPRAQLSLAS